MAYKLTPEQYKDVAEKRIENKNTAENTNSAVSAYARALDASRAADNKNKVSTARNAEVTGDVVLRTYATYLAPLLRFSEGVAKYVENSIIDTAAGLTASVLGAFDLTAADKVQDFAATDYVGEAFNWYPIQQIYANSYSNEWGKFGELLQEGIYSVGQQAIPFALDWWGGPKLSKLMFALGTYGGGFESASQDGGDALGSSAYGLASAVVETIIEAAGGTLKWGAEAVGKLDEIMIRILSKTKGTTKFAKIAADAVQEGGEEVVSGLLDNYIRAMTYKADRSSVEAYFSNIINADTATAEELLEQFLLGAVAGTMMGGVGAVASKVSPTVGISESIQELEAFKEKGYELNQRGKDATLFEQEAIAQEASLMDRVNENFDKLTERRAKGDSRANAILGYMEQNFDTDENGRFVASKNVLMKNNDNVSYGVTEREVESVITQQGNQVHQGIIEGEAAETKSLIQKTIDNYNKVLSRKNSHSRLKLVIADISDNADGTRSYGYVKDNVVVIDARGLTENVDFTVLQGDKKQTYSVNGAMSTLLHEVFHFTEDTKAGQEMRRILAQYAADNTLQIEKAVEAVEAIDGSESAKAKRQELAPADLLAQTQEAYADKGLDEQISELSARQLENLLFNERIIRRLTEDNSTLAKRILNNAKRLWDAVRGLKIAETKELETLINKTIKLYNKAIAEVGSGKYLTSDRQTEYSKSKYSRRIIKESENVERSDEFRRIQAESLGLSDEDVRMFHDGRREVDEGIRGRLSRVFGRELVAGSSRIGYEIAFLINKKSNKKFSIYGNVDADTFHDIFEIVHQYLDSGDAVDIHDKQDYRHCRNYLTEDGLAGFSITPAGDLISVFNLGQKGFLSSIRDYVREQGAVSLDCYQSKKQELAEIYQHTLGFKTASILDFNYDILMEDKGKAYADYFVKTYGEAPVHFMVLTDADVEVKHFEKDDYIAAVKHREQYVDNYSKIKYSRRVVAKEGVRRSIDDAVEMLAVVGDLEDETHDIELSKGKLIDGYIAQINNEAANGRLNANSKVVRSLMDSILETAVMTESNDEGYVFEQAMLIENLRRHFHSMNLASVKSEIQSKYGKTNNIFKLWGSKENGRGWDTVVQEIVEEMPQLAVDGDFSGVDTLFNIFDAYTKAVEELKKKRVEVKPLLANVEEVKDLMAKQFIVSIEENSTELVKKVEADVLKQKIVELQNAVEDTFTAIKDGASEVSFQGKEIGAKTANQLRKIVEDVAQSRASVYARNRTDDMVSKVKKDLTAGELKELRKTDAYKDLEKQIYGKYLQDGKEVSFKSIEENEGARLLAVKREISSIRNITRMNEDNRARLSAMKSLDAKTLLSQLATYKDSTFTDAYKELQKRVNSLYKKASDGDDYLMSYNEMIETDALLDTVKAFDKYLSEENPALDFYVATGDFVASKGWIETYLEYIDSIKGMKYTDMTMQDKSMFSDLLNRFLGTVTNTTTAERRFEIRGESYSARSYIDRAKSIKEATLKRNSDGTPQMPRKGAKKALSKLFFKPWARPKTIITYMEGYQYGKDRAMGGLLGAYTALEDGLIKSENTKNYYLRRLFDFVNGKGDHKGRKSISHRLFKGTITVKHSEGTVKLTVSEAVSLYKTLTQADNELNYNANDLLAGGIDFVGEDGNKYRLGHGLKFTEENISELYNSFKEQDLEYIAFLEEIIEELGEKEKAPTDVYKFGNPRLKDNYWPSHVAGYEKDGKLGDKNGWYNPADPVENLSIAQRRERDKKTLIVKDSFAEMIGYINSVSMYSGLAIPLENFNIVYNLRSADGLSYGALLNQTSMFDFDKYLKKLLLDIQGAKSSDDLMRGVLKKLRSNYSRFVLSFNPKTPIVQLSSLPMLLSDAKDASAIYGISHAGKSISNKQRETMYKYCPAVRARFEGGQAYRAEGNLDDNIGGVIGQISEAGMKGIEAVDFFTVFAAWETYCKEVGAVGDNANNPALLQQAGWRLADFLDSIDRFDMTSRNEISRSENPVVTELSMFHSSPIGMFDALCRNVGRAVQRNYEKQNLPKLISAKEHEIGRLETTLESKLKAQERANAVGNKPMMKRASEEVNAVKDKLRRARLGLQYLVGMNNTIDKDVKAANHWARKTACCVFVSLLGDAAISTLFLKLLNGDDEEEEAGLLAFISDLFGNMLSLLPGVGALYNALDFKIGDFDKKGYDANLWIFDMANDVINAVNSVGSSMNGQTGFDTSIRDTIDAVGKMFGVPTRNFNKILDLTTKAISPSANYKFNNIFGGSAYSSDLEKAIEAGDTELAETITRLMMKDTFGDSDTKVVSTIRKLYEQGYTDVIPRTVSSSVRIDGTSYEMTRKQQARFKSIYSKADETIEHLVGKQSFVKLSPKIQADAIKWIYDYYYNRAKEDLSGVEDDSRKALFGSYIEVETLAVAYSYCRAIEADTDKKGKTVNGTRKTKVVAYLNSLRISAAEKYMILGYLGYSPVNQNAKTFIANFAKQKGASKQEIAELLGECNIAA